eukprot:2522756-Pyramimonas_sp.AAC.1
MEHAIWAGYEAALDAIRENWEAGDPLPVGASAFVAPSLQGQAASSSSSSAQEELHRPRLAPVPTRDCWYCDCEPFCAISLTGTSAWSPCPLHAGRACMRSSRSAFPARC